MNKVTIKFKKLYKDAKAPFRSHADDRGADLFLVSEKKEGSLQFCGSGLAFEFPDGIDAEVRSRSSCYKVGAILMNGVGTIDHSYRGEVKAVFLLVNEGTGYSVGDRFCQMIIPGVDPRSIVFEEVEELSETARGDGGYGSTGNK